MLRAARERLDGGVWAEVLDDTVRDEHDRADEGHRQEDAHHGAREVGPEVADARVRARAGEPAHERDRDGHPDGGRDEVLHGQTGHLQQVARSRLAGVPLPVRVRDERDGGVPGARGVQAGEAEVQGQVLLQASEPVEREQRGK